MLLWKVCVVCGLQELDLRWMVNETVLCDCAVWD